MAERRKFKGGNWDHFCGDWEHFSRDCKKHRSLVTCKGAGASKSKKMKRDKETEHNKGAGASQRVKGEKEEPCKGTDVAQKEKVNK